MSYQQPDLSRRKFLGTVSLAAAGLAMPESLFAGQSPKGIRFAPLAQFDYGDVTLSSELHEKQLAETHRVLMGLSDDSLLKPLRLMSGQPAPGEDIGGWYRYNPDYKYGDPDGFAPSCTFGQWVSALARMYAITRDQATRQKVLRLNRLYAETISGDYYDKNRFPTYCYDKIVCGLIDSHKYVGDRDAFSILDHTTNTALPHFPGRAVEHGTAWRPNKDFLWTWDESYTISENLFLAYQCGAGKRYRELGRQYLDDAYYDPLADGWNNLAGRHAYSHVTPWGQPCRHTSRWAAKSISTPRKTALTCWPNKASRQEDGGQMKHSVRPAGRIFTTASPILTQVSRHRAVPTRISNSPATCCESRVIPGMATAWRESCTTPCSGQSR